MEKLDIAIKDFLINTGLENGVKQQKAVIIWPKIVGTKIAENTTAELVDFNILTIKVKNSTWRNELYLKKDTILEKLNTELGPNTIKELRFL
jgi:predicted nucleic acid-binding Zn ribbon protein